MRFQLSQGGLAAGSSRRSTNSHAAAAAAGHQAYRSRAIASRAQPEWTDLYNLFSASDNLDEAARRLRLKTNQMAKKGPLSAGQSASLAAQKLQIDSQDALAAALQQMAAATAHEQYEEAARLRDESLAWLEGWHKPVNANSSQVSSLLYVKKDHSRWTGRWFTPGDFMHFDMQTSSNPASSSQSLQMSKMLKDPRYGTPLFEVFVLPAEAAATAPSGLLKSSLAPVQSTIDEESTGCSSFTSLVVALQSVQRAMNEVLKVVPVRRPSSCSSSGVSQQPAVRITNQRIMVLADVSSSTVTAAAVHAGNDSTLLTWHTELHATHHDQDNNPAAAAAGQPSISGPQRPAESGSGAFKVTFTLDWHELDLLRGPGSIQRTGPSTFQLTRKPLPTDVPRSMCSSSNGGLQHNTELHMFRVDMQYHAPIEPAAASHDSPAVDGSSSSTADNSRSAWADRVGAELQQQLAALINNSCSSSVSSTAASEQQVAQLAALLAAAATGTAPADAVVSGTHHLVKLTQPGMHGTNLSAAAAAGLGQHQSPHQEIQQEGEDILLDFEKVSGTSIDVSFGGWEVTAHF